MPLFVSVQARDDGLDDVCRSVSLKWNKIGTAGCKALVKVISGCKNTTLRCLDVSYNEIGCVSQCACPRGFDQPEQKNYCGHISMHTNTRTHTGILTKACMHLFRREDACLDIARAIQESPSLRDLRLSGNPIGEAGALRVLSGIMQHSAIAMIEMKVRPLFCACVHICNLQTCYLLMRPWF